MLNKVIISGRLTRDPELRQTQSGVSVTSFSLACDRDYGEDNTDFFNVTAWRGTAEFVNQYFEKGQMIVVEGRLQQRYYTDREGTERATVEIVADRVYFCGSKTKKDTATTDAVEFTDVQGDDGLPF